MSNVLRLTATIWKCLGFLQKMSGILDSRIPPFCNSAFNTKLILSRITPHLEFRVSSPGIFGLIGLVCQGWFSRYGLVWSFWGCLIRLQIKQKNWSEIFLDWTKFWCKKYLVWKKFWGEKNLKSDKISSLKKMLVSKQILGSLYL